MSVPRDPQLPQINAGQLLYGEIPVELLPSGETQGQTWAWVHEDQTWVLMSPPQQLTVPLFLGGGTIAVDATDHTLYEEFLTRTDFDYTQWTHFNIYFWGNTTEAGETVDIQAVYNTLSGTLSEFGGDLTINDDPGFFESGWINIHPTLSGLQHVGVSFSGSTATVDLDVSTMGMMFKNEPTAP